MSHFSYEWLFGLTCDFKRGRIGSVGTKDIVTDCTCCSRTSVFTVITIVSKWGDGQVAGELGVVCGAGGGVGNTVPFPWYGPWTVPHYDDISERVHNGRVKGGGTRECEVGASIQSPREIRVNDNTQLRHCREEQTKTSLEIRGLNNRNNMY